MRKYVVATQAFYGFGFAMVKHYLKEASLAAPGSITTNDLHQAAIFNSKAAARHALAEAIHVSAAAGKGFAKIYGELRPVPVTVERTITTHWHEED